MKRLALILVFLLAAARARAVDLVSCAGVTVAGACVDHSTSSYGSIIMTVRAAAATASTTVIEFKTCDLCDWTRFPKSGDPPITNIGSDGNALSRSFKLPGHIARVRWNVLTTDGSSPIYAYVSVE